MCAKRIKFIMTRLSVCSLGVSCNEMIDTPMLLVVVFNGLLITFDIRNIIQYLFNRTPVKKLQPVVSSILGHVHSTIGNTRVSVAYHSFMIISSYMNYR